MKILSDLGEQLIDQCVSREALFCHWQGRSHCRQRTALSLESMRLSQVVCCESLASTQNYDGLLAQPSTMRYIIIGSYQFLLECS